MRVKLGLHVKPEDVRRLFDIPPEKVKALQENPAK
jgi:hypothetical protein